MQERKALGKGLSSLIPMGMGSRADPASKNYLECPLADIVPNQSQPRKLFDKASIDELAASIEERGVLQPLIVRRLGGGKYELVAGERRYRAAQQLRLEKIPVVIKDVGPQEILEIALIENLQREDLNPIEEALAYKELLDRYQYTQDEVAKRLGRDRSSIANAIRLLKLPESVRAYIIAGKISMGHARAILGIEGRENQETLADEIIKNNLSVREIEEWIRRLKEKGASALEVVKAEPETKKSEITANPFRQVEEQLKMALQTKVQIKSDGRKGKIVIHFSSREEFERLYQKIRA
ncbi:MAG: ParB/RepB/Spo0J family partition protein [Deltaproteobacteria bacterium]|nr:ParB/RepB/Spo0J family partition protein [Deltaproteobacteria bacterium]